MPGGHDGPPPSPSSSWRPGRRWPCSTCRPPDHHHLPGRARRWRGRPRSTPGGRPPSPGTGRTSIHTTGGAVGTYPGLVPDSYLDAGADGGVIAAVLLLASGAVVAASIRRRDLLTSCAAAATVAFAVAGCVDFAWQLPAIALLGGSVAGLAALPVVRPRRGSDLGRRRPSRGPHGDDHPVPAHLRLRAQVSAAVAWTLIVVAVVGAQALVGDSRPAGGATRAVVTEPPHLVDTSAPGRQILTGPDPTDPFMITVDGRYSCTRVEGTSTLNVPLRTGPRPGSMERAGRRDAGPARLGRGWAHLGTRRAPGGRWLGPLLHRPGEGDRPADPLHRRGLRAQSVRPVRRHQGAVHLPAGPPRHHRRTGHRHPRRTPGHPVQVRGQRQPVRCPDPTRTDPPGSTPST